MDGLSFLTLPTTAVGPKYTNKNKNITTRKQDKDNIFIYKTSTSFKCLLIFTTIKVYKTKNYSDIFIQKYVFLVPTENHS